MADFAKMHRKLFKAQTDAITILQEAQQETEEMFISAPEADIRILKNDGGDNENKE